MQTLGTQTQGTTPMPPPLAARRRRWGARLIDALVLLPFGIALLLAAHPRFEAVGTAYGSQGQLRYHLPVAASIASLMLSGLYEVSLVSFFGQTLGKRALGLVVLDRARGEYPSFGRAAVRYVVGGLGGGLRLFPAGRLLAGVWIIDLLWSFGDDQKRCLHDLAAGTIVVERRARRVVPRAADPSISDIDLSRLRSSRPT